MPDHFTIPNWTELQHQKKRNAPWCKLYWREVCDDRAFLALSEVDQLALLKIRALVPRLHESMTEEGDPVMPWDPSYIQARGGMRKPPNLEALAEAGFIQPVGEVEAADEKPATKSSDQLARLAGKEFDALFWPAYPAKNAKKKARELYVARRLKNSMPPVEQLVTILDNQDRARKKSESPWPYATTWINGDRWEDELKTGGKVRQMPHGLDQDRLEQYRKLSQRR